MGKKTPLAKAKDRCDKLARELNVIFHKNKCCWCGRSGKYYKMDWSHVKGRRTLSTRWEQINAMLHCFMCHHNWHHDPAKSGKWFEENYPGREQKIIDIQNKSKKMNLKAVLEVEKKLQKLLDKAHINT